MLIGHIIKGYVMKKKICIIIGLFLFSMACSAASLLETPALQSLSTNIKANQLQTMGETISKACLQAWQNQSHQSIFDLDNSIVSQIIPLKQLVSSNANYACNCIKDEPTLQGTIYGALYIEKSTHDTEAAQKFLTSNLRRTIQQCFWKRERNENGRYVSANDINLKIMLKKCKTVYAKEILKNKNTGKQPSVEEVLEASSTAEEQCNCIISRDLVSRISYLTVDILNYELSEMRNPRSLEWRLKSTQKTIQSQAEKCKFY
jgi:hypothetical protein